MLLPIALKLLLSFAKQMKMEIRLILSHSLLHTKVMHGFIIQIALWIYVVCCWQRL